jgi:sugar phosphate permease
VVLAASLQGFFGVGTVITGFLVLFLPIREELHLSSASMSLVIGLAWAISGVLAPVSGWMCDKFGTRRLVLIGGLVTGLGMILLSFSTSFWHLLLLYSGVVAIGRLGAVSPTLMTTVNQWFVRRKALALSILSTSFVAGGAAIVPLMALGSASVGWRDTLLFAGVFLCLLVLPVVWVLRDRPEDLGLEPDGSNPGTAALAHFPGASNNSDHDFTVRQAIGTWAFWLVLIGLVLRVALGDAIVVHQIPILVWKGIDEQTAAFYLSLMFLLAIPLRFGLGVAAGYLPVHWLLSAGMAVGAFGTTGLFIASGGTAALSFVLGQAVVEGISTSNWLAVGLYFGRKSFGRLVGIMTVFSSLGSLISPVITGWLFDRTQSYEVVILAVALLFLLGGAIFLLARKPALR